MYIYSALYHTPKGHIKVRIILPARYSGAYIYETYFWKLFYKVLWRIMQPIKPGILGRSNLFAFRYELHYFYMLFTTHGTYSFTFNQKVKAMVKCPNHYCSVLQMGRKAVGHVCCVMYENQHTYHI